jgi:hypothetical protein
MGPAYLWGALGLSFAPVVSALVAQAPALPERGRRLSSSDLAACINRGGRIRIAGRSGNQTCALPLADAGKACSSSSQCTGVCLLDEARLGTRRIGHGDRVPGRCQPTTYGFGCSTIVEHGRISSANCID